MAAIETRVLLLMTSLCLYESILSTGNLYRIGAGIADITGPAAGIIMMGYAQPNMVAEGIHTRLYARTFIMCEHSTYSSERCVVYVNLDACMTSQIVKMHVSSKLRSEYGGVYHEGNVLISSSHTHSGPAGYLQYVLFQISNLGWVKETFDAQVTGILRSIRRAHKNLSLGKIHYTRGNLENANINRSPSSYLMNPAEERAKYHSNTDKEMFLLKFFDKSGEPKGSLNWFAVHPTSMNNSNHYISSDNKGYAELMFESVMNGGSLPGKGKFVAAFSSTNLGDVSPNINGPVCIDTGLPCDIETSTCNGRVQNCIASGPGRNMFESTQIIGYRQFNKAMELFHDDSHRLLAGPIGSVHRYIDMSNQTIVLSNGKMVSTCSPAMGYSFAAGTTDGPGMMNFFQSDTRGNQLWDLIRNVIKKPSDAVIKCHYPKPVLISTGEMTWPYEWQPSIVPVQMVRVGQLVIAAVPGEFTTMAGRRLRAAIKEQFADHGVFVEVVIAGLSNAYADYVTTYEEYQKQRYEGASTIYGPYTLAAYIKNFKQLAVDMIMGSPVHDEAAPPNLLSQQMSLVLPVMADYVPSSYHKFGQVITQPAPVARAGDTVQAVFVSGHPLNNAMLERSFLHVLYQIPGGQWIVVATDSSWNTLFKWRRTSSVLGYSEAIVRWTIPTNTLSGTYRLKHMGYHRTLFKYKNKAGKKTDTFYYEGESNSFEVIGLDEAVANHANIRSSMFPTLSPR